MHTYSYPTPHGPIQLVPRNGRYVVIYDDENLGSYGNPLQALDDVVGGHTFSPSDGIDFADLDLPDDLGDWHRR